MPAYLTKFLPFLRWLPLKGDVLRADFLAGLTVALVLIPQSMAYVQLAGLPAYYGLARAFVLASAQETWGLVVNEAMAPMGALGGLGPG